MAFNTQPLLYSMGTVACLECIEKLSSFTTVLMVNLEPVYGILLAMLIYHENKDLGIGFYLGILLIAFSVALHTLMMYIEKKRERKMIA